jgi:lipooligosaccharide transport system permease protein
MADLARATEKLTGFFAAHRGAATSVSALGYSNGANILASVLFAAVGMLVAAGSRTIESISYPQYLVIFPMFLFCGVYFPLSQLPDWGQAIAAVLPLTALLSIVRTLLLGFQFEWWALPLLLVWTIPFVPWARRAMRRRVVA